VQEWIEATADAVAEEILGSALAPAVVQPPRGEKIAYFRSKLFLPGGLPNPMGRDELLARYGAQGYQDIALAVAGDGDTVLPDVGQGGY
jgi:hypothetical protein